MCPRRTLVQVTTILLLSACGKSSDNCPGLCPDENIPPTMTISTADGFPSIASAKIVSGPCTQLLIRSSGEVGMPTTYAAVQVTYNGSRTIPPLCLVELTSRFGQIETITAEVTSRPYQQTCCPYGTCCPTANTVTQHDHVEFAHPTETVSFPPPPDGGVEDGGKDAATDASAAAPGEVETVDATEAIDVSTSGIDLAEIDSGILESPAFDGATEDVPGEPDLASGS